MIVLTSPHSFCAKQSERTCDLLAELASKNLYTLFNNIKDCDWLYVPSNTLRSDNDLNRIDSRDTAYRKALDIVLSIETVKIILDIHSFTNYYMEEAGPNNLFNKDEIPPDIVIMTGKGDDYEGKSIGELLFDTLRANNINTKIIKNNPVLDIINYSSEKGIPGVLIEFNEKLKDDTYKLNYICLTIVRTIRALFSPTVSQ